MLTNTVEVQPIAGALGAEIHGVDLANMSEAEFSDVHRAFLDHCVVFFRDQTMTPAQQVQLAKRFGEIHFHPFVQGLDEQPEILEIIKREEDTRNFGGVWHTDQAFSPKPALATFLYAKQTPKAGGDTMFANMYLAYETLSDGMKQMIKDLRTVNLGDRNKAVDGVSRTQRTKAAMSGIRAKEADQGVETDSEHPLVRTHPETGRKGLYLSSHTVRFAGMTEKESAPLLNFLKDHATQPGLTCRFRWDVGSLAIWDNRCTQHIALNDYQGQRRVMHRITVAGDKPV
jgi:taurine dioxygenase